MSDTRRDFDAWRREQKREGIRIKLFGQEWILPGTIPADLMLTMLEMLETRDANQLLAANESIKVTEQVVGADNLAEWRKHPEFDLPLMREILFWTMRQHMGLADETEPKEDSDVPGEIELQETTG